MVNGSTFEDGDSGTVLRLMLFVATTCRVSPRVQSQGCTRGTFKNISATVYNGRCWDAIIGGVTVLLESKRMCILNAYQYMYILNYSSSVKSQLRRRKKPAEIEKISCSCPLCRCYFVVQNVSSILLWNAHIIWYL